MIIICREYAALLLHVVINLMDLEYSENVHHVRMPYN